MSDITVEKTKSKAEILKEQSRNLRGSLVSDVKSEAPRFGHDAELLLKFHGIYQQKDRDRRRPGETPAAPKPFTLMVRGRIPGGRLSWRQWEAWDRIADRYANHSLRLTTRQSVQLHGVLKHNLAATIQEIHTALSSTKGACGDVVRNVTQAVNPRGDPQIAQLDAVAERVSRHFETDDGAYFEIFLNGEPQVALKAEPIYGRAYLPRKFKIGVTVAGNNAIDIYTQDLGLAATFDTRGALDGFFVFVGGGLGQSHSDSATKARLADLLGWIPQEALIAVSEAVVTTQRDYGDREDRTFARLKYLIDRQGLEWFKSQVEERSGLQFAPRALPPWKTPAYLGWNQHSDGSLSLGFHTLSGRLSDTAARPLKSSLRELIVRYQLEVQITPDQDLILYGIPPAEKKTVEAFLDARGLSPHSPRPLYDRSLTCVALPTCIKALAEAERVGPEIFAWLQESLDRYELNQRAPIIRVTGCPNGCARPYTAEIGLVGQMPGQYALFLGGDREGLRLAVKVKDKVKFEELPQLFDQLARLWSTRGEPDEGLGDFVWRQGPETLGEQL